MAESKLSRWSRLKQKGGADAREETQVRDDATRQKAALAEAEPETIALPGGARVRHFVPAMPPLAPAPEDDDDRFTRGVGHAEPDDDAEEDSEVSSAEADVIEDIFDDIEEHELSDEEKEVVAGLPPVEQLTPESDFTPFLRNGVPDFIKRRALRMLWMKDPFFNIRDGLNDYDEDFNIVHKIIDEMVGNYKVGRGYLSEEELKDMTPKEARKVFYPEDDDEEDADAVTKPTDVEAASDETSDADEDADDDDDLGDADGEA